MMILSSAVEINVNLMIINFIIIIIIVQLVYLISCMKCEVMLCVHMEITVLYNYNEM